ncbi:MAG: helix-turn-helix transcriptional regulator [Clostridia bacterium]|nr:helix-turn-helix transcriptional regulator [Clostridia bacterium]
MDRIHTIGYDAVHPADFIYDVHPEKGTYLLILTSTPARFWFGEESRILGPHQAALFASDSPIRYGACEESYGNDWMIFSSDETYVTRFPLMGEPFPVTDPEYCHNLFQLLTWEHRQNSDSTVVSRLLSVLLFKLEAEIGHRDTGLYGQELMTLRQRILNRPQENWSVPDMADRLHLSAGYLQLLYKQRFGISCMEDVIQSRLRLAQDYLAHTNMSVAEIAALCGYRSTEHFCRQFHRTNGMTPGQYRKTEKI